MSKCLLILTLILLHSCSKSPTPIEEFGFNLEGAHLVLEDECGLYEYEISGDAESLVNLLCNDKMLGEILFGENTLAVEEYRQYVMKNLKFVNGMKLLHSEYKYKGSLYFVNVDLFIGASSSVMMISISLCDL